MLLSSLSIWIFLFRGGLVWILGYVTRGFALYVCVLCVGVLWVCMNVIKYEVCIDCSNQETNLNVCIYGKLGV